MKAIVLSPHAIHRHGLALAIGEAIPGAEVVGYAWPDGALGAAALKGIGLVFVDLTMSRGNDERELTALVETVPGVPVVVLSGTLELEPIQAALRAGVTAYVHQGQGVEALRHILQLALSGQRYYPVAAAMEAAHAVQEPPARAEPNVEPGTAVYPALTDRQLRVLSLLADGLSNKEIARDMNVLEGTVKSHVRAIISRLGARNRTQVAVLAARRGLGHGQDNRPSEEPRRRPRPAAPDPGPGSDEGPDCAGPVSETC